MHAGNGSTVTNSKSKSENKETRVISAYMEDMNEFENE